MKHSLFPMIAFWLAACSAQPSAELEGQDGNAAIPANANAACAPEEFNQLDFWLGDWDLSWQQVDGSLGMGRNVITKSPYGNCVVTETFDGAPTMQFRGMSVSTYHVPSKLWRQTWVDDQGGYFALYGGSQDDGTFKLDMTRLGGQGPYRRMVWKDIQADSLVWHWQGKTSEAEDWQDQWVITYTRRK